MLVRKNPHQGGKPVVLLLWPPSSAGADSTLASALNFKPLFPYLRKVLLSLLQRLKWSVFPTSSSSISFARLNRWRIPWVRENKNKRAAG